MKKRTRLIRSEQGQSIVLIAVVMVSLLALAGLAIDGGNLFLQRRRVQNAADAGALAGTRVLAEITINCEGGSSANDARVAQAVAEFVASNGFPESEGTAMTSWYVNADEQQLAQVGAGSIPQAATGVEVQLEAQVSTYFLKVVGIEHAAFGGEATAMTGPVIRFGGGLLPIAVPLDIVEELDQNEEFIVVDTSQDGSFCRDTNGNGALDGSDYCLGDPSDSSQQRGWLNLNYVYNREHLNAGDRLNRSFENNVSNRPCGDDPGRSTDDGLQGWAGDGCPYPYPIFTGTEGAIDGDFIHGGPGARSSAMSEVIDTYNGRDVIVPIFDHIYTSDYMRDYPEYFTPPQTPTWVEGASLSGDHWPAAGGGGSAFLYHIVGFTVVRVNDPDPNDKALAGSFQSAVIGEAVIQPGGGLGSVTCTGAPDLFAVNLWR
jgi:Flp pilus assembly protein TadG